MVLFITAYDEHARARSTCTRWTTSSARRCRPVPRCVRARPHAACARRRGGAARELLETVRGWPMAVPAGRGMEGANGMPALNGSAGGNGNAGAHNGNGGNGASRYASRILVKRTGACSS